MVFEVEEMAVQLVELLRPVLARIRARDRALSEQLSRAASSVVLNAGRGTTRILGIAARVFYGGG
jgi:hypothetical protein